MANNNKRRTKLPKPAGTNSTMTSSLLIPIAVLCAGLLIADAWFPKHGAFEIEHMFGFYAAAGLIGCFAIGLIARVLRGLLIRPEDYYDR